MSSNAGRTRAVTASPGLAPCGANEYGPPSSSRARAQSPELDEGPLGAPTGQP
jgi:hypothetical protein